MSEQDIQTCAELRAISETAITCYDHLEAIDCDELGVILTGYTKERKAEDQERCLSLMLTCLSQLHQFAEGQSARRAKK